jgi:hypothetical protein
VTYRLLAAMIVHEAMKEWRALIRRKLRPSQLCPITIAAVESRLNSLRAFFRSAWCDVLMCGDGEGEEVLKGLEAQYRKSVLYKQISEYKAKEKTK